MEEEISGDEEEGKTVAYLGTGNLSDDMSDGDMSDSEGHLKRKLELLTIPTATIHPIQLMMTLLKWKNHKLWRIWNL